MLFLAFTVARLLSVNAFTTSPANGELAAGSTVDIQILAAPQTDESGIELDIQVSGMTITSFTPSNGWLVK